MRTITFFLCCIFIFVSGHAQFYYKDVVLSKQTAEQLQRYKLNKIHTVKAMGAEASRDNSESVQVDQSINNTYSMVVTTSRSPHTGETTLATHYNAEGFISKTIDTTDGASSTTTYTYDAANRVTLVKNSSASTGQAIEKEEHRWNYNTAGQPLSMLKIRNDLDTTFFTFVLDEKGNVIEEKSTRKGRDQLPYFYYYDAQDRLTDIVHYNPIAKRLLPDYIFEYDASGKVRSMLVVQAGGADYQRWMYTYDDRGLKTKEIAYNKSRHAIGTVEYRYE